DQHDHPERHFDTSTTEPVSFFLSSLEELLAWRPTGDDDFNVAATPLAKRQPPLHTARPRTLVCHDMKGGYLEDRFIQGSATRNPYVFYHWRYIDVFVYFSHRTVTIPPVCWTNAAHRNGVPVLGTFIAEWVDGEKLCEAFLAGGPEAYRAVSEQLARIAQHYRFDGWFVNLENKLSEAAVRNLPLFLRHLTARVHEAVPGGLVLWYDSIVQSGQLQWQNELNEQNREFFDACDGLFVNYNWKEEQLERSKSLAGQRLADVYFGIDVFARGDVLGGGFDSDKPLSLIRKHGFSAAIFAPGWVYERLGEENFLQNENEFWGLLAEHLPTHSICTLPFATSFSLGMGSGRFVAGKVGAGGRGGGSALGGQGGGRARRGARCPPRPSAPHPAGGRGRALVRPERSGDPAPLRRAPGRAEHELLPGGRLARRQLPAGAGHHPRRRGARRRPVSRAPWPRFRPARPGRAVPAPSAPWGSLGHAPPRQPNAVSPLSLLSCLCLSGWIWGHQPFLFPGAGAPQAPPDPALQAGGAAARRVRRFPGARHPGLGVLPRGRRHPRGR
uniref:Cytosolic endo-beta-N-acetylglucosaminidase n=1 Tax=Apteryx owenii TaxID=8824 RepID=A0A8B9P1Q3_APTOW